MTQLDALHQAILDRVSPDIGWEAADKLIAAVLEVAADPSYVSRLRTIKQFAAENSAIGVRQLNRWSAAAGVNGLLESGAMVKTYGEKGGPRVFIHVDRFDEWFIARTAKPSKGHHWR